jgi:hypothetical protein
MFNPFGFCLTNKILVPRRSPSNIRIDSINGTSAKIHWNSLKPTDQGGFITNYQVIIIIYLKKKVFDKIMYHLDHLFSTFITSINAYY